VAELTTIELVWRRGSWCARLSGADPKYGLRRDFEKGTPIKARGGVLRFTVSPGFYELAEYGQRRYIAVTAAGTEPIPDTLLGDTPAVIMATISDGPAPNEPGAWRGLLCHCGAELDGYTGDGFPYCAAHGPAQPTTGPCPL
jgi:hypothetical protein